MSKQQVAIILRKDVKKLGQAGEVVKARAGYVRNFLVPSGLAEIATDKALAAHQKVVAHRKEQNASAIAAAEALAKTMSTKVVTVRVKAGQKGKLFGSVTAADISKAAGDQHGWQLTNKQLKLKSPVKALGKHTVPVELDQHVKGNLTIQVVSTKG
ncbi:MAG: 50S ribosomal protein L9 [Candidatus Andersenbacteria bacterium]